MDEMKILSLISILLVLITGCFQLPHGSNIRTGIVRSINSDTINFYGSKNKFILENKSLLKINDTIQYTVIKTSTDKYLPIIRKL